MRLRITDDDLNVLDDFEIAKDDEITVNDVMFKRNPYDTVLSLDPEIEKWLVNVIEAKVKEREQDGHPRVHES